jgi:hypothetical protein
MKFLRCLYLFLILAAVFAPAVISGQDQDKPLVPKFTKGSESEAIAADIFDTIVYLPAKLNGQGSYSFVLDTGNDGPPFLNEKLARALKIPLGEKLSTGGAGAKRVDIYLIDKIDLAFPGLEFKAAPTATMPLDLMDPHWGKHKDGMIGVTVFANLVTDIDYAAKTVHFRDPGTFSPPAAKPIPIEVNGQPFVTAKVFLYGAAQPVEAFMMLDTGVRITTFNSPFSRKRGLPAQSPKCLATMTGWGIGGESWGVVGRVRAIEIGGERIEDPVVDFSTDKGGALASDRFDGIIGSDILHRFHAIFDYPGRRLFLEKNAGFGQPFEYDMLGARLAAYGDKLDVIKIFHVADKTPARAAGLLRGDEILAIDGRKAAEFNWEMLKAYFRQPGKEVRLEIARGGKRLTVTLTLRRLV